MKWLLAVGNGSFHCWGSFALSCARRRLGDAGGARVVGDCRPQGVSLFAPDVAAFHRRALGLARALVGDRIDARCRSAYCCRGEQALCLERLPHHLYPPKFAEGYVLRHMVTMFVTAGLLALLTGFPWAYMQRPKRRVLLNTHATGSASGLSDVATETATARGTEDDAQLNKIGWQAFGRVCHDGRRDCACRDVLAEYFSGRGSDASVVATLLLVSAERYLCAARGSARDVALCRVADPALSASGNCGVCLALRCLGLGYDGADRTLAVQCAGHSHGAARCQADVLKAIDDWSATDWREMGQWVRANTPSNAKFLTPRQGRTFKWHAQRAEVVTNKDIPQHAAEIMNWWGIQDDIYATHSEDPEKLWHRSLGLLSVERLREICAKYGAQYVVIHYRPGVPKLPLEPLYQKGTFWVYRLR